MSTDQQQRTHQFPYWFVITSCYGYVLGAIAVGGVQRQQVSLSKVFWGVVTSTRNVEIELESLKPRRPMKRIFTCRNTTCERTTCIMHV